MPNIDPFAKLPKRLKHFHGGANVDADKELLGTNKIGMYYDLYNGRSVDDEGNSVASRKIKGELLIAANDALGADYECMGSCIMNGEVIEIWADNNNIADSVITCNGVVILKSSNFPAVSTHHFQIATNPSCIGGEIIITDYHPDHPPMYFNIGDIKDALVNDPTKYFSAFDINLYTANVNASPSIPVFYDLEDVGAGGGLPVGQYMYALRYVSDSGGFTALSPPTPLIYVPNKYIKSPLNSQYPFVKNYGGASSPESRTRWGIRLKFRVNNFANHDFIELVKISYNSNEPVGFTPGAQVINKFSITPGEVSIIEYTDSQPESEEDPVFIDAEDTLGFLTTIKRAKGVRYFKRRVIFMNVEYESKDLDSTGITFDTFSTGNEMEPFVKSIGSSAADWRDGYNFPFSHTYEKGFMNDDAYGFAIVGRNGQNQITFAVPVTNFKSFKFNSLRDPMNPTQEALSINDSLSNDAVETMRSDGTYGKCFECWDHSNLNNKAGQPAHSDKVVFNILDVNDRIRKFGSGRYERAKDAGYLPMNPKSKDSIDFDNDQQGDDGIKDYDVRITSEVWIDPDRGFSNNDYADFNPYIYAPQYRSTGIALKGISNIPNNIDVISVVRTRRAGKVVCQGLAFYRLRSAIDSPKQKYKSFIGFHSPDIDNGLIDQSIIDDMQINPSNYRLQVVSPYGFTSDVYNYDSSAGSGRDEPEKIDMIVYPRVREESDNGRRNNPGELATDVGYTSAHDPAIPANTGQVGFGRWRNPTANPEFPLGANPNTFGILQFIEYIGNAEEANDWTIELDSDLYLNEDVDPYPAKFTDTKTREWEEPVYIVNIIQDGREIPDNNIQDYLETGTHIKVRSLVGVSSGSIGQAHSIIDERPEDFHVSSSYNPNDNKYVYIEQSDGTLRAWINVSNKDLAGADAQILIDASLPGGTVYTGGTPIYGVYESYFNINGSRKEYAIKFSYASYQPESGLSIIVKYDNNFPIKVFGGDTFSGETIYPYFHLDGTSTYPEFDIKAPLPYPRVNLNTAIYIPRKGGGFGNQVQNIAQPRRESGPTFTKDSKIRQLIIMYTCQSYSHTPLAYGNYLQDGQVATSDMNFFPMVGYAWRPHDENSSDVFPTYFTDHPGEDSRFQYGGFKWKQFEINLDYSKEPNYRLYRSKPSIGFKEKNLFCTRTIWSQKRDINVQFAPGLKTFKPFDFYDISDNHEEIKYAYDDFTDKGHNLYAVCGKEICLLLTDKRTIHSLDGDALTMIGAGEDASFVQEEIWLNTGHGVPQELWRTIAENEHEMFFCDKESAHVFTGNDTVDIGVIQYLDKLHGRFLSNLQGGYGNKICAVYDTRYNEYWIFMEISPIRHEYSTITFLDTLSTRGTYNVVELFTNTAPGVGFLKLTKTAKGVTIINNSANQVLVSDVDTGLPITGLPHIAAGTTSYFIYNYNSGTWTVTHSYDEPATYSGTLVFSTRIKLEREYGRWVGEFDYKFDKLVSDEKKTYGSRDYETWKLHEGYVINGVGVKYRMQAVINIEDVEPDGKEFIRMRINSNTKPVAVNFYENYDFDTIKATLLASVPNQLRDYDNGYEQYIPRELINKNRNQGTFLYYQVQHDDASDFIMRSNSIKFKSLE